MSRSVEDVKMGIFGAEVPAYSRETKRRSLEEIENKELKKEIKELKAKILDLSAENRDLANKLREIGAASGKKPERKWLDMLKL